MGALAAGAKGCDLVVCDLLEIQGLVVVVVLVVAVARRSGVVGAVVLVGCDFFGFFALVGIFVLVVVAGVAWYLVVILVRWFVVLLLVVGLLLVVVVLHCEYSCLVGGFLLVIIVLGVDVLFLVVVVLRVVAEIVVGGTGCWGHGDVGRGAFLVVVGGISLVVVGVSLDLCWSFGDVDVGQGWSGVKSNDELVWFSDVWCFFTRMQPCCVYLLSSKIVIVVRI